MLPAIHCILDGKRETDRELKNDFFKEQREEMNEKSVHETAKEERMTE